jgi:uncharacterized damage-inducible protein DinB
MQRLLVPDSGTPSRLMGLFLAQLDDQSRRLTETTRGATPEELTWQSAPGMNTIGMLLAHIAAVEVGWVQVGLQGLAKWEVERVLDREYLEFGMPLAAGAAPPAWMAEQDLAFYDSLLARARGNTRAALAPLADADFARRFQITRPNGQPFEGDVGWVLYHVLEHLAGHFGQILLLRHAWRDSLARRV